MAYCIQCGAEIEDCIKYCTKCGLRVGDIPLQPNISQSKPDSPPQNISQPSEIIVQHVVKRGNDASAGFGRSFGETTGTAFGCFVIAFAIIAVLVLIAFFTFR
jgi:hypothetical protein